MKKLARENWFLLLSMFCFPIKAAGAEPITKQNPGPQPFLTALYMTMQPGQAGIGERGTGERGKGCLQ